MLIDAHTHIFAQDVADGRDRYVRADTAFGAIYANPRARIATAASLLREMDEAGVDTSVALGFGWGDAALCARHNDALLEAAARDPARIIAFATVWPGDADTAYREAERCARAGARGLGELRPAGARAHGVEQYGLDGGPAAEALAAAARDFDLTLTFHASEPFGHAYPGKEGGPLAELLAFVGRYPDVRVIAAHWGGGLPFYALMPEVREALRSTWFDTAATSLLYDDRVYATGAALAGSDRVLFGSDFPLLGQRAQMDRVRCAPGLAPAGAAAILGDNAARLFGIDRAP